MEAFRSSERSTKKANVSTVALKRFDMAAGRAATLIEPQKHKFEDKQGN